MIGEGHFLCRYLKLAVDTMGHMTYINITKGAQRPGSNGDKKMTNQIDTLTTAITAWDMQDVRALRDLIADLKTACDEAEYDFQGTIDMANLPSAQIPDDIDTSYPVWAVDAQGMALVGPNADEIESLEDVRGA